MIVDDAPLTPLGELTLDVNTDCEFCGGSMISRFGGVVATNECPSCSDDFKTLNRTGKLVFE